MYNLGFCVACTPWQYAIIFGTYKNGVERFWGLILYNIEILNRFAFTEHSLIYLANHRKYKHNTVIINIATWLNRTEKRIL